jgi:hypothetical protein
VATGSYYGFLIVKRIVKNPYTLIYSLLFSFVKNRLTINKVNLTLLIVSQEYPYADIYFSFFFVKKNRRVHM